MKKLKASFEKCFGTPILEVMLPDIELIPVDEEYDKTPEEALLLGSRVAAKKPYLIQGEIAEFIVACPEEYFLIGFWGHGVNSYAFYYSRVDSWSRVFFRLPYGGVYMDNEKMAQCVREFLSTYFDFERQLAGKAKSLVAVDSMGGGYYNIKMLNGKSCVLEESLFEDPFSDKKPSFGEKFGHLFL